METEVQTLVVAEVEKELVEVELVEQVEAVW